MLANSIIEKIRAKYGKDQLFSADCALIADAINEGHPGPIVSVSTIKRLLGFAGTPSDAPTPRNSTLDTVAKWLGYENYKTLLREVGEGNYSSEFTPQSTINANELQAGTQVQFTYEPSRYILMTYLGNNQFMVNESKNSKLIKGDLITLTTLVLGQLFRVTEVVRNDRSLGGYTGAMDGGLTTLEIIT